MGEWRAGLAALLTGVLAAGAANADATLEFGRFGVVHIYQPAATPTQVVLFISGDGGWNAGVTGMARRLASRGALVAGIDINEWGRGLRGGSDGCIYTAGDLEQLGRFIEARYALPRYVSPVLAGYSSGATLAYTSLVQSPRATFKGALSLGFCPSLPWPRPMCAGDGPGLASAPVRPAGFRFEPAPGLRDPWITLHGTQDQVCAIDVARAYVAKMPHARLVELPRVGHGYSVERNYLAQFLAAYDSLAREPVTPPAAAVPTPGAGTGDLPLVEVAAAGAVRAELAIMLSGDGGWTGLDRELGDVLAAAGIPVVGWDSLRYFWNARTPAGAAADLDRVMRHYLAAWGRSRVVLVGYSLGADTLPFLVNRLPPDTRQRVALVALLAPGARARFEFHVSDWVSEGSDGLPVSPEIRRLGDTRLLCIYAAEEPGSPCASVSGTASRRVRMPGGHHFDGDYAGLGRQVLKSLENPPG